MQKSYHQQVALLLVITHVVEHAKVLAYHVAKRAVVAAELNVSRVVRLPAMVDVSILVGVLPVNISPIWRP